MPMKLFGFACRTCCPGVDPSGVDCFTFGFGLNGFCDNDACLPQPPPGGPGGQFTPDQEWNYLRGNLWEKYETLTMNRNIWLRGGSCGFDVHRCANPDMATHSLGGNVTASWSIFAWGRNSNNIGEPCSGTAVGGIGSGSALQQCSHVCLFQRLNAGEKFDGPQIVIRTAIVSDALKVAYFVQERSLKWSNEGLFPGTQLFSSECKEKSAGEYGSGRAFIGYVPINQSLPNGLLETALDALTDDGTIPITNVPVTLGTMSINITGFPPAPAGGPYALYVVFRKDPLYYDENPIPEAPIWNLLCVEPVPPAPPVVPIRETKLLREAKMDASLGVISVTMP